MDVKLCCCLAAVLLLFQLSTVDANEVLNPKNVTDNFGNHADSESQITWAPIPEAETPYTSTTSGNTRVPKSLRNMVNGFTYVVQPQDPPYDLVIGLLNGKTAITDNIKDLALFAAGIAICFVLGILFIVCMPCVGCFFCCCRICGNCGGKLKTTKQPKANLYCRCLSVSLLLVSATMIAGITFVYFVNYDVSDMLLNLEPKMEGTMNNLKFFLKNTVDEVKYVAEDRFAFIDKVITRDLNNIGFLVGKPVRDELDTKADITTLIQRIYTLDNTMDKLVAAMGDINTDSASLKTLDATLDTRLAVARSNVIITKALSGCVSAACTSLDETLLDIDADFSLLPDLTTQHTALSNLAAKDMSNSAKEGKKTFDDIPERVVNETKPQVADIKSQLNDFKATIQESLEAVTELPNKVEKPINDVLGILTVLSFGIVNYDSYRSYATLGCVSILAVIVGLQIAGVILACCCYNGDVHPKERSTGSHCGGNCLMAGVGLSFIFSWLLMIFVAIPFIIGAPLDRDFCDPLTDPEFKMMKKLLDSPGGLFGDGYFMSGIILGNSSIPLTVSGVLKGCQENYPSYSLLKLNNLMNIDDVTDYKKKIDIESQTGAMTADFSDINILSADTKGQLLDLKTYSQIPIAAFKLQLLKSTTKTDLTVYANNLRTIAADSSNSGSAQGSLKANADEIESIQTTYNIPTQNAQKSLLLQINAYDALSSGIPNEVDDIITVAGTAETTIHLEAPMLMNENVANFTDRILSVTDDFAKGTSYMTRGAVGKCRPVWLVWESLIHQIVCEDVVGSVNAFWFMLGWCVFFMVPSIILSVKLAKYLRRMDLEGSNNVNIKHPIVRAIMSGDPKRRRQIRPMMEPACLVCGGTGGGKCAGCGGVPDPSDLYGPSAPPAYDTYSKLPK